MLRQRVAGLVVGILTAACGAKDDARSDPAAATVTTVTPAPPKSDPDTVRTRLFGADVPAGTLPLSISIETIGGVSSVILKRGTPLPAEHTEIFSTGADDQPSVEVSVSQGERPMARDNRLLGKFQLTGIPPAARGVPQIDVTFRVDAAGVLDVSAKDLATHATRKMTVSGAGDSLTRAQIDEMLADALAHQRDDASVADQSSARNELDALISSTRKLLANAGTKIPPDLRASCEQALTKAEAASAVPSTEIATLRTAHSALQAAVHQVTAALYKQP